ncbi:MAG: HAD family hydrolase [Erysipelotrichaceae bacterium]|nr:HAD family hydrolase [Erysipelotrichaceae bacterium]
MKINMIKVFITDVDGTLFDHQQMAIPDANIKAINELQQQGIKVIIATARTYASSLSIVETLQLKKYGGYLIASNGGAIYDLKNGRLIDEKPIPLDGVKELYAYAECNNLHFTVEQDDYVITSGYDEGTAIDNLIVGSDFLLVSPHNDFLSRIKSAPMKVNFTQNKALIDSHFPLIEQLFSDRFYVCHAGDNFIDIVLKDVNKSSAVAHLLKILDCDFTDAAAIGDGDNDSWLLAKAGFSAAMGNGTALAKQSGKMLVSDCGSAGLSEFVDYLLKQ